MADIGYLELCQRETQLTGSLLVLHTFPDVIRQTVLRSFAVDIRMNGLEEFMFLDRCN